MSACRWAFVTASSLGPSCLASRDAAGCTCRLYTPHTARTLPTRVAAAFRTAHLHSGPISRTKFECAFNAPIIARGNFPTFSDPPKSGWGLALAGLCSSAARRGLAGQEGGGREAGGRRGAEGPFLPRTGRMRSPSHCERHDAHALSGDIRLIRTRARCVRPPLCDCACVTAARWGRPRVRLHCCCR